MAEVGFRVGTAGWSVPKDYAKFFPVKGSHLERYAQVFNAVEINSSFYRDHMPKTYKRWAEETPENFSFSVKLNKLFTHEQVLIVNSEQLAESLEGIQELKNKLGVLLVQLPPGLDYNAEKAERFFEILRQFYHGDIAFEPRHLSWQKSVELLERFKVSKVIADPELCRMAHLERKSSYWRLHGSPKVYYSQYFIHSLEQIASQMKLNQKATHKQIWCIFDNTAEFYATKNALQLTEILKDSAKRKSADLDFWG